MCFCTPCQSATAAAATQAAYYSFSIIWFLNSFVEQLKLLPLLTWNAFSHFFLFVCLFLCFKRNACSIEAIYAPYYDYLCDLKKKNHYKKISKLHNWKERSIMLSRNRKWFSTTFTWIFFRDVLSLRNMHRCIPSETKLIYTILIILLCKHHFFFSVRTINIFI